jgi:hypothetical protein
MVGGGGGDTHSIRAECRSINRNAHDSTARRAPGTIKNALTRVTHMPTGIELFEWVKNKTTEGHRERARGKTRNALACYLQGADLLL